MRHLHSLVLSFLFLALLLPAAPAAAESPEAQELINQRIAEWLEELEANAEANALDARSVQAGAATLGAKTTGVYTCLPTCSAIDGKLFSVAGNDLQTLARDTVLLRVEVPAGETSFTVGFFDGDSGGTWDLYPGAGPGVPLEYTLFEDGDGDGTGVQAAQWSGASLPDNAWADFSVGVGAGALTPSGSYSYLLEIRSTDFTQPMNWSNFKVRTTGVLMTSVRVAPVAFAFTGPLFSGMEGFILYPNAGSGDFETTTYDGTWSFFLDIFETGVALDLWDGDFDRGAANQPATYDTDDPDTPGAPFLPDWADLVSARPEGVAFVVSCGSEQSATGCPADDRSASTIDRRAPSIEFSVYAPDGQVYPNSNPSGNREWEHFGISTEPFDPTLMDHSTSSLPPGHYEVRAQGVDLNNLNAWRFFHAVVGVCEDGTPCVPVPRPYLVGDTVWFDIDGDGIQGPGEPGIAGVLVNLLDSAGHLLGTATTDADGHYTIGVEAGTWTVEVDASNFDAGGALEGLATTTGDVLTFTVVDDNVLTYDFGYRATGAIGDRVWRDQDGNGVQDAGEPGLNGVTVVLKDATGTVVATQVTAGDGDYLFEHLPPGDYSVEVDASTLPAGLEQTYDLDGLATPNVATLSLGLAEQNLEVDFGYQEPAPACQPCDGKVTELTLRYEGHTAAYVKVVAKKGNSYEYVYYDWVSPGEELSISGPDGGKFGGTLGTEIQIYVKEHHGWKHHTTIHTSCSEPIGPGLVSGDFVVVAGESKNGGALCPIDGGGGGGECGACDGKVTELTLRYEGHPAAYVKVVAKKGNSYEYVYYDWVSPGEELSISGPGGGKFGGTLGTEIQIYVKEHHGWKHHTTIHTSCSEPIGPGLVSGDFVVVAGESKNGGALCPIDGGGGGCADCADCPAALDFETDPHGSALSRGSVIAEQFAGLGIHVTTHDPFRNPAMIFDSAQPTGGDWDLGTPNEDFGGPGIGRGGERYQPGENRHALGKVLIVSEDGKSWNPDDAQNGGTLIFTFDQAVEISEVDILDVEETGSRVVAFGGSGNQIASVSIGVSGNNGFQTVAVNATGVRRLEVRFKKSGALARVAFCPEEGGGEEPSPAPQGTGTIGYWKNHGQEWPVSELKLGAHTFPKSALIGALGWPSSGNKALDLAKQLTAAKLNVAAGTDASCIAQTIDDADAWLSYFGFEVSGSHWGWTRYGGETLHRALDDYNNGRLCAPHRG